MPFGIRQHRSGTARQGAPPVRCRRTHSTSGPGPTLRPMWTWSAPLSSVTAEPSGETTTEQSFIVRVSMPSLTTPNTWPS